MCPTALGQPHFLIEGTVAPSHQCDLVGEVFYRNIEVGTELSRAQVSKLQKRHFVEVMRQVGPLWVVKDAVVPAPGPTALGHNSQYTELTGHLGRE